MKNLKAKNIHRLEAFALDGIIITLIDTLICFIIEQAVELFKIGIDSSLITNSLWILITLIYFSYFESSQKQATPGKRFFGICVSSANNCKINIPVAFARNLLKHIPIIITLYYLKSIFGQVDFSDDSIIYNQDNFAFIPEMGRVILFGDIFIFIWLIPVFFTKEGFTIYDWLVGSRVKTTIVTAPKINVCRILVRLLTWIFILIAYLFPFVLSTASLVLKDPKLNPEINIYKKKLLTNDFSKDNGFIHMVALVFPDKEKAFEEAKSLIKQSMSDNLDDYHEARSRFENLRKKSGIGVASDDLEAFSKCGLYSITNNKCLTTNKAQKIINYNRNLLERYRELYKYNYVSTLGETIIHPITEILDLRKLNYLEIKVLLDQKKYEEAFTKLKEDILFWQRLLNDKTSIVIKSAIVISYKNGLHYLNNILYNYPDVEKRFLDEIEIVLSNSPLEKNLFHIYRQDLLIDCFFTSKYFDKLPSVSPILFINQVKNNIFEDRLRISNFAKLPVNDIEKAYKAYSLKKETYQNSPTYYTYNIIGNVLASITSPNLDRFLINYHKVIGFEKYLKAKIILKKSNLENEKKQAYLDELPKSLQNHFLETPFIYKPEINDIDCYDALRGSYVDKDLVNKIESNIKNSLERRVLGESRKLKLTGDDYSIKVRIQQSIPNGLPKVTILKSNASKAINELTIEASKKLRKIKTQVPFLCPYEFSQEVDFTTSIKVNKKN